MPSAKLDNVCLIDKEDFKSFRRRFREAFPPPQIKSRKPSAGLRKDRNFRPRAVIFNTFGTLLLSPDAPASEKTPRLAGDWVLANFRAERVLGKVDGTWINDQYDRTLRHATDHLRDRGNQYPEIDASKAWASVISRLKARGYQPVARGLSEMEIAQRLHYGFDQINRPCAIVPELKETILNLRKKKIRLGIFGDAQFSTLAHLADQLGLRDAFRIGDLFCEELCFFSYREGSNREDPRMISRLTEALKKFGILPRETVLVSNEWKGHLQTAAAAGFVTALGAFNGKPCAPGPEGVNGPKYRLSSIACLLNLI